jgi:type IV pilus assembly protein PilE
MQPITIHKTLVHGMDRVVPPSRGLGGFTLIELMIVCVVVAVLGMLALPSYLQQVRKSRRSDAIDATSTVLQAQERWRANNTTYSANFTNLAPLTNASRAGYYQLAITAATATGYTLTATAVNGRGQEHDSGCATLTATVDRGAVTYAPSGCWSR